MSFIRRRIASCADASDVQHKTKALTVSGMHKEHMSESDTRTVRYWMTRKRPTRAGSNLCGLDAGFPSSGRALFKRLCLPRIVEEVLVSLSQGSVGRPEAENHNGKVSNNNDRI